MKVLITGGAGMIGRAIWKKLLLDNTYVDIIVTDINSFNQDQCGGRLKFVQGDLRDLEFCKKITAGVDTVIHAAGIKGSPDTVRESGYLFFLNMNRFNQNVIDASVQNGVSKFVYFSSIGIYSPCELMTEDLAWEGMPSKNDWLPGWSKRIGELTVSAYLGAPSEKCKTKFIIVRPANVFGPYDNFEQGAMVVPSLIVKSLQSDIVTVHGDGTPIRDFVYSEDVASMTLNLLHNFSKLENGSAFNLGSGERHTIADLVSCFQRIFPAKTYKFTGSVNSGDRCRVLDVSKIKGVGCFQSSGLHSALAATISWATNEKSLGRDYNVFRS